MKIGQQLTGESPVNIRLVKSKCLSGPNELVRKPVVSTQVRIRGRLRASSPSFRVQLCSHSIWLVLKSNSSPFINSTKFGQVTVIQYIFPDESFLFRFLFLPAAYSVCSIIQRYNGCLPSRPILALWRLKIAVFSELSLSLRHLKVKSLEALSVRQI